MSLSSSIKKYGPAVAGIAAAALTGGAAAPYLLAGGLGMSAANISAEAQKDAERRQFEYTKELNAEMNAYNTPEAQMERYVKAGINPYMASVSSGTQGSAGSVSTASTNPGAGFDRAVAIANAQADLKAKALAIEKQGIENSYLPAQIESTIAESINKSNLLQNQALTQSITGDILKHDYGVISKGSNTTSKDNAIFRISDRLGVKLREGYENSFTKSLIDRYL